MKNIKSYNQFESVHENDMVSNESKLYEATEHQTREIQANMFARLLFLTSFYQWIKDTKPEFELILFNKDLQSVNKEYLKSRIKSLTERDNAKQNLFTKLKYVFRSSSDDTDKIEKDLRMPTYAFGVSLKGAEINMSPLVTRIGEYPFGVNISLYLRKEGTTKKIDSDTLFCLVYLNGKGFHIQKSSLTGSDANKSVADLIDMTLPYNFEEKWFNDIWSFILNKLNESLYFIIRNKIVNKYFWVRKSNRKYNSNRSTNIKDLELVAAHSKQLDKLIENNPEFMQQFASCVEFEPKELAEIRLHAPNLYRLLKSVRNDDDSWKTDLSAEMGELGF